MLTVYLPPPHFPQAYGLAPSVCRDAPPGAHPSREETYDVPPHFSKVKQHVHVPAPPPLYLGDNLSADDNEPEIPEDVYDVPPPILKDQHHGDRSAACQTADEVYDTPANLRAAGQPRQDVYDFPRELDDRGGERNEHYIYDVPPQVGENAGVASKEITKKKRDVFFN